MARAVILRTPLVLSAAAIAVLFGNGALAQTAREFDGNRRAQSAYADWRKLSQTEVNCIDRTLRQQGTTLWKLIERGVAPSSAAGGKLLAACHARATAQAHPAATQGASQALATTRDVVTTTTVTSAGKSAAGKTAAAADAAQKPVASQPETDKAGVGSQALAERAAANQAAIEKAAADRAVAEKAEAERAAAAEKASEQAAKEKAAAAKAAPDQATMRLAQADTEKAEAVAKVEPATKAQQGLARSELVLPLPDLSVVEARSFIYGLFSGPALFVLGGIVLALVQRRRRRAVPPSLLDDSEGQFDRLVTAVMVAIDRRLRQAPAVGEPRDAEAVVH